MVTPIQTVYSKYQQKGQVGACARPSAPFNIDKGVAGVEMKPGQGCYYSAGDDAFILPTSDATRKLCTHIVGFNANAFNTAISAPTTNNISEIIYSAGDIMPLVEFGHAFVLAGETIENGDAAIYNHTTEKWIKYAPASATPNDLRKKAFEFYVPPGQTVADGDIVEIRVPSLTYAFPSLGAFEAITSKVSLTASEIKALRASPAELVAAPGAGNLLQLVGATLVLTAGSEVLTETADNMAIEFDGGSAVAASGTIEATGFIDQAADTMTTATPAADAIDATADVVNKNLALVNTGDGEYAGNASDDAALDVYITYRVLDLS